MTPRREIPSRIGHLALALLAASACSKPKHDPAPAAASASATAATGEAPREGEVVLDLVKAFDACVASYRGEVVDLGDEATRDRVRAPRGRVERREREGATWAAVSGRTLDVTFFSPVEVAKEGGVQVQARVRGGAARTASVYLNGRPVGPMRLAHDEAQTLQARGASATIERGRNELSFRFALPARSEETAAEIDWVRVGAEEADATYAAPTRRDLVSSVRVGGVSRQAISTRAPGHVRCAAWIPAGARLEAWVGGLGGEVDAEVRLRRDRTEPIVLGRVHATPERWERVSYPIPGGAPGMIELVGVTAGQPGARAAFGDPRVARDAAESPLPAHGPLRENVVMVVLGSVSPTSLSVRGGRLPTPSIDALAKTGWLFTRHRSTSAYAAGALASMLTGLPPSELAIAQPGASLPEGVVTTAVAARQAGIATAMFTANPTTSAPFGFGRGWEQFGARAPTEEASASRVFEDAAAFVDAHKSGRFFVVVHARGGHPPWDVTQEDLRAMTPPGYTGRLEPRHAAETLAKARRAGGARLFSDTDRQLAFAMHEHAVTAHDQALEQLLTRLKTSGHEDDTTVIVVGDVGASPGATSPFIEQQTLEEGELDTLLVIRPSRRLAVSAKSVDVPVSSVDLARTTLAFLGLDAPTAMRGAALVSGGLPSSEPRPQLASMGRGGSLRWGPFVLTSPAPHAEGKLCSLDVEPACVGDVRATHPIAEQVLERAAFDALFGRPPPPDVPPAGIDDATAAALRAWGSLAGERRPR